MIGLLHFHSDDDFPSPGRAFYRNLWDVQTALPLVLFGFSLLPILPRAAAQTAAPAKASPVELPPHLAEMQVQDLRAGGDEKKRYFLIRKPGEAPNDGWRTLFVLPGGSGDAEFRTFVTALTKFALPEGYQTVELVAPVWDPQQAQNLVWPTEKSKPRSAKFSTLDFFLAVRTEVEKSAKIDPRYVFTLTWSSSGTNGYLLPLTAKAGVTGSFVAMSVFHPQELPSLEAAKGKPYFIYHSPMDFIPIAQAEAARDALKKAGATVELVTYNGGHGWTGETMPDIRRGITWLEEHLPRAAVR
jgi:predicted esterase